MRCLTALVAATLFHCGTTRQASAPATDTRILSHYVSGQHCVGRILYIDLVDDDYPDSVPAFMYACEHSQGPIEAFRMSWNDLDQVKTAFRRFRERAGIKPGIAVRIELDRLSPEFGWIARAEMHERGLPLAKYGCRFRGNEPIDGIVKLLYAWKTPQMRAPTSAVFPDPPIISDCQGETTLGTQ